MGIFTAAIALFSNGGVGQTERLPEGGRPESEPKLTVLVIDDDPSFLEAIGLLLRGAGYNVLTSATGPKGLDMIRYARDVRLVLLDYNMPRFNGAETLEFLRKLNPDLKIIAVSAFPIHELPESFRAGVQKVVPKPFSNDELLRQVEDILREESETTAPVSIPA